MPTKQSDIVPGQILEGKVQGITKFGAFIELAEGLIGLVHISEIADSYVKDVKDFVQEGDTVKVKVLNVNGKKVGLSMKQAVIKPAPPKREVRRPVEFKPRSADPPPSLDDKISRFLKESDERMQPLKSKNNEPRRRSR